MATKPNTQPEGTPCVANEPKVEYQTESKYILTPYVMESLRRSEEDYKAGTGSICYFNLLNTNSFLRVYYHNNFDTLLF